jgi:hypothetical protein
MGQSNAFSMMYTIPHLAVGQDHAPTSRALAVMLNIGLYALINGLPPERGLGPCAVLPYYLTAIQTANRRALERQMVGISVSTLNGLNAGRPPEFLCFK